jgi:hypothetical protein
VKNIAGILGYKKQIFVFIEEDDFIERRISDV